MLKTSLVRAFCNEDIFYLIIRMIHQSDRGQKLLKFTYQIFLKNWSRNFCTRWDQQRIDFFPNPSFKFTACTSFLSCTARQFDLTTKWKWRDTLLWIHKNHLLLVNDLITRRGGIFCCCCLWGINSCSLLDKSYHSVVVWSTCVCSEWSL